ncbi:hypothetical protein GCM10010317_092030 [Streptomyces mirabilis]|uniref:hypothetical protein n=1 Tax=Streptomyces mirabilis TaxID=68239 RepID=UPI00167E5D9D|nr:hypothetical protein [Streptomyces mirabilis]GHD76165.1 hypothetical protein GCM10010317_092030 [Streptomyces mirabilis]
MTLSNLFARRPAAQAPATWTPLGTTVVQRYRNRALGFANSEVPWSTNRSVGAEQ